MPTSLNFDFTQFLKRQNALYLLKYKNDPTETAENPAPIAGFSGHVPCYRSSLHNQRAVRSLVRCLTSPTKPTTATGFKTASNQQLPQLQRPFTAATTEKVGKSEKSKEERTKKGWEDNAQVKRAQSAPPVSRSKITSERATEKHYKEERSPTALNDVKDRPIPSRLSMMSAGSADYICRQMERSYADMEGRPRPSRPGTSRQSSRLQSRLSASRPRSSASTVSDRPVTRTEISKHPTGYTQTLYGSSYWYAWPDVSEQLAQRMARPESYYEDQKLNRANDVIYHKHEGIVPKYMGYVPGYKFRHGSTYGVLTANPTDLAAVHSKREFKVQ